MSLAGVLVHGMYRGYIAGGFEVTSVEVRTVLVNVSGGALFASQSNVEYAMWPATTALGSIGAPSLKGSSGTTDSLGQFAVDVTGTFYLGDEVALAFRQSAGSSGGADDNYGFGAVTVSAA